MSPFRPWFMWLVSALFFSFQFVIRIFPGLCVPEIMHKYQIDATEFGFLSSIYYYGYAGMQIPITILLERFGPRLIVSLCCFLCSSSIFLFYSTDSWHIALFARFLIGVTSAAGFLGAFKVISLWFPVSSYAKMIGYTTTIGLLGAVYGGYPVNLLIRLNGWDNVLPMIGVTGLILTGLLIVTIKPYSFTYTEGSSLLKDFKSLFSMPFLLLVAFGNLLMVGALEGFADIWGVSYLIEVYSFEKNDASFVTSFIFIGMIFGGPILAYFSEKFKVPYQLVSFCGFLISMCFASMLLFNKTLGHSALSLMMLLVGILCCYQVLIFTIGAALVPTELRNMTIAFLNCTNMLGGIFFHTIIGALMDAFWTGKSEGNQRVYEAISYENAIWIIPLTSFIGGALFLWLRHAEQNINKPKHAFLYYPKRPCESQNSFADRNAPSQHLKEHL